MCIMWSDINTYTTVTWIRGQPICWVRENQMWLGSFYSLTKSTYVYKCIISKILSHYCRSVFLSENWAKFCPLTWTYQHLPHIMWPSTYMFDSLSLSPFFLENKFCFRFRCWSKGTSTSLTKVNEGRVDLTLLRYNPHNNQISFTWKGYIFLVQVL